MSSVLIIDDEPTIVDAIRYALETEGMQVNHGGTGASGLAALEAESVDLVVLDVGLPDMSGFDVCREIRKVSNVPIIFLTARTDEIDRIVGLELGADDYVVKPFSPREVAARVKAVLRRAGHTADTSVDDTASTRFDHNEQRMEIRFCEQRLELSRTEYRLLAVLLERPGWVFTRDQLMDRAWEDAGCSTARTVDTHIKTLRAKLREIQPDSEPIRTHRGVGYSLDTE